MKRCGSGGQMRADCDLCNPPLRLKLRPILPNDYLLTSSVELFALCMKSDESENVLRANILVNKKKYQ